MWLYCLIKEIIHIYYKIAFRVDVKGTENIPKEGGVVLCCNHTSNFDPPTMAIYTTRQIRYIAKKELFANSLFGKFLTKLGAFPVDRSTTDMKALKTAIKLLKNGEILGIFAEGTRVKSGESQAAKAGVALFALKANVPIVPVCISGTYRFGSKLYVRYGTPISTEQYQGQKITTDLMEEVTGIVMEKVREMKVEV